ncbi:conjugal transfer protein TrbL family protein [Paenibacillus lutrae]|uniref:Conjugal transfer protein TrbL n=1 Tax=Paenibacillus lutrae TaxID=2078573 RepID=A0A7X3FMB0_9BACL|nr:conjugal transfer protein TrbL family protein [Paenibacillus lutrae]MVP02104.1 hypothetical protein [Paenibacillus lutrae]
MYKGMLGVLAKSVDDIANNIYQSLQDLVFTPTNLNNVFLLTNYVHYAQILAAAWLTLVLVIKAGQGAFLDQVFGETSIGELAQRAIAAYGMIYLFPWLIDNLWLKANNYLVEAIFSLKVTNNPMDTLQCFIAGGGGLWTTAMAIAMLIAAIWLCVTATIRYVEIMGFYLFSPVIATSLAYKGELFPVFAKELSAVVFSQVWQATCIYLMFGFLSCGDGLLNRYLAIAVLIVAGKGPAFLKGWAYYSSGLTKSVGGGVKNATRMAVYGSLRKI